MKVLSIEKLSSGYGKVQVLYSVNLDLDERSVLGVIGPNGAGKTTLLKTIIGLVKPWSGRIFYINRDITNLRTYDIVRLGIGYCPERGGIFRTLTVKENLELVASSKRNIRDKLNEVYRLFPILKEREHQIAGTLSGGEQKMLCLARALLLADKLMLLDEPSSGLAPILREKLAEKLKYINRELEVAILIVEQDPTLVAKISEEVCIMERGTIAKKGSVDEVLRLASIREHYFGL